MKTMSSPIPDDFCVFILSYKRPDNVKTYNTVMSYGYTGKLYIVCDNTDDTVDQYRKRYGEKVLVFDKHEWAAKTDDGDNTGKLNTVLYARNACWDLARQVGCRYFIVFDDDYISFRVRYDSKARPVFYGDESTTRASLDSILLEMLRFYKKIPALSIAMAQGGDYLGGSRFSNVRLGRKVMNSFICSTDRPFTFFSRMNDDVSTYVVRSMRGELFFTVLQVMLTQIQTQMNSGGLTDMYLDSGTYVKSFYTVMYAPSCCKVGVLVDYASNKNTRFHHTLNWNNIAPRIIRENYKKS